MRTNTTTQKASASTTHQTPATERRRPFEPPRLEYQGRLTEQTTGVFSFS
ncbi:MAG: hypothetical protein Q9M35_06620 [Rhodothermus sp.]|nr:hypothetical protein [Rhodothermus sp.]